MSTPKIKLTELREYRSERTGSTYFAGFLGKARVVMLRDDRAEITGKEVARWSLLLEEAEPREERGPARGGGGAGFSPDQARTSGASAPRSEGRRR